MATFNQPTRNRPTRTTTFEGGPAIQPNPLLDLMFTTVCTFVGQDTFYESADARMQRIRGLVADAVRTAGPLPVVRFIRELRLDYKIRAAALLVAAEFARAGVGHVRAAVSNACQRADEPAEFLAYWLANYGRKIPRGVKLGLGDAALRLYTERNALKWDSKDRPVRMGDVIELCHPKPNTPEQATLFRYLLDLRHRGKDAWEIDDARVRVLAPVEERADSNPRWAFDPNHLSMFANLRVLTDIPEADRRDALRAWGMPFLRASGMTWEKLSAWLPGGMDAEAWQFAIPQMQVMALLRNLRNFDQARLPDEWVDRVIAKITSEEDVKASRVFPYQVLSAYQFATSDNWKRALGKTLDLASGNVPQLDRSLLLIDSSASMRQALSEKSQISRIEVAALQAISVGRASNDCDLGHYAYGNELVGPQAWRDPSVLRAVQNINLMVGRVGHNTLGHTAIRSLFDPVRHDRVILFTDDQQQDSHLDVSHVPQLVTFNVGGYAPKSTWGRRGGHTNIQVAGFSDAIFGAVARLLSNFDAD